MSIIDAPKKVVERKEELGLGLTPVEFELVTAREIVRRNGMKELSLELRTYDSKFAVKGNYFYSLNGDNVNNFYQKAGTSNISEFPKKIIGYISRPSYIGSTRLGNELIEIYPIKSLI